MRKLARLVDRFEGEHPILSAVMVVSLTAIVTAFLWIITP